ncbi:hypothetical protein D9756_003739 [Leucocoprinus leucothites]|uniref:Uncharacterized protein n=1 Tax=Leucocoprinus leucothites TaxID=201217 RepID=A0A8H5D9I8_9AGAR|nr:hypothetical protein D9756_003739 [Leucoagaricus leucothites]
MSSQGSTALSPNTTEGSSNSSSNTFNTPPEGFSSSLISLPPTNLDIHSTSIPIIPQSSDSGLPSLTASSDLPMTSSGTSSGPRSIISSQPIQTNPKGDSPAADTETTAPMASNTPKPSNTTNTRDDSASGPTTPPADNSSTTNSGTTKAPPSTSSEKPTTSASTRDNAQTATSPGNGSSGKPPGGNTAPPTSTKRTPTSIAVVRPSNTSTVFTTITSSPESTLRVPSSIPVTNSINGIVSLTAPPLITVLSTSTQADGAFVTFTHLVANPGSADNSNRSNGFLANQGQVAGVFTVVGVVTSALIVALFWFIRRCRRRQRRKAWFDSLRQYPPSPFAEASYREPHETSLMRSVQTTSEALHEPHLVSYHDPGYRPRSQAESTDESISLGLTGVGTTARGRIIPLRRPPSGGDPFRDPPHAPQNTPVSISPNRGRLPVPSGASIAPSSPSIYPESLPPTDDTSSPTDSEPKPQLRTFPEPLLHRSLNTGQSGAPPRPPRSHLRDSQKPTDFIPLTPPSSQGHSKLASPETQYAGLPEPFTPRTWLNVRPRTAPETSTSRAS